MSNMITPSTRLRRAIHMNSASLAKRIIDSNPHTPTLVQNVDLSDKANTSLHLAATLGQPEIAALLLSRGHESSAISRNLNGETPLMLAAAAGPDDDAPRAAGRLAVARLLLDGVPGCAGVRDRAGRDAFAHAARAGSHAVLALMLAQAGPAAGGLHPLLASCDGEDNTALHHASAFGHLKSVRVLVAAGADAGAVNAFKWTPVDYSATVQAEVYLRGLVRERDQQHPMARHAGGGGRQSPAAGRASPVPGRASPAPRMRGDSWEKGRVQTSARPVGGVRLVSSEDSGTDEEGGDEGVPWQSRARART